MNSDYGFLNACCFWGSLKMSSFVFFRKSEVVFVVYAVSLLFYFKGILSVPIYFSPSVIVPFVAIFISALSLLVNSHVRKIELFVFLFVALLSLFLICQDGMMGLKHGFPNEFTRLCLPFVYGVIGARVFARIPRSNQCEALSKALLAASFLLLLIALIRILFFSQDGFYGMKYNSLFYPDSNFEGYLALFILLFSLSSKDLYFRRLVIIMSFFSVGLSFSRAAWACSILGFFIFLFFEKKGFLFFLSAALIALIPFWYTDFFSYFSDEVLSDGSFKTKLGIIGFFLEWLAKSDVYKILFGEGSGGLIDIYGRESHNILGIFVEIGLFFGIAHLAMSLYLMHTKNIKWLVWGIPLFLTGLISLHPIAYMAFAYCVVFSYRKI